MANSPEALQLILKQIKAFMGAQVPPLERRFLHEGASKTLGALDEKRQEVKRLGLWAPHLPKEHGGLALALPQFARVSELLGASPVGHYLFNCQAPDVGNMEILMQYGTREQKTKYLEPLARGQIRSCFAMTEPDHPGSNPTWMSTTAVKDGDDYVINGRKWFATGADGATFAVVMAISNPAESAHRRASQILVPLNTPGFQIVRWLPVMGEPGSGVFSHAEIFLANCRVPQSNRLGPEGAGFAIAQERLGPGRIHHCMRWIGICERAFDLMCQRATTWQLAPGVRLGDRQLVQAWIAESRAEINAARLMVLDAAQKVDEHGAPAAREEISLIKFYVAGVLQRVLDRSIQAHGGLGLTDDLPLAFWYRHERAARIYDGADEVHKESVAKRILKRYSDQAPSS